MRQRGRREVIGEVIRDEMMGSKRGDKRWDEGVEER